LIESYGEGPVLVAFGALVGAFFGAMAQHSRFCLRAATVELAEGQLGPRLAIWLVAFSAGVVSVQAAIWADWLDVSQSRQLATTGIMSGAIIGGLMFGAVLMGFGSMLAGGCAVGAGMSGGAIFALTAWVAVGAKWLGAIITQLVLTKSPRLQIA
jgi:uncharacterized membrane protein YedE/YeeE